MGAFDRTRPLIAIAAVGLARRAMDEAARYATQRKTMGQVIGQHQAVSFMLADMAISIEASRLLVGLLARFPCPLLTIVSCKGMEGGMGSGPGKIQHVLR